MEQKLLKLKKNDILFSEGDTPDAMYIVKKGRLLVTKKKRDDQINLAELKQGDLLGEMSFFSKSPRNASAKALIHDTEVIEVPFSALEKQFKSLPPWTKTIIKSLTHHIEEANTKIRQLQKTTKEETEVFSDSTILTLMSILGLVSHKYGKKKKSEDNSNQKDGDIVVSGEVLRNITIQIFLQPTHKMKTLTEVLEKMKYLKIQKLENDQTEIILHDLDFIFYFVDFHKKYMFNESAKKQEIPHIQMNSLKVLQFYGEKEEISEKGFVKVNLTKIAETCKKDTEKSIDLSDVRDLSNKGILGEYSVNEEENFIQFQLDSIQDMVRYWDLVHALKAIHSH